MKESLRSVLDRRFNTSRQHAAPDEQRGYQADYLNDPKAQAAWAGDGGELEPVRLAQKECNYRSITIAESCRQAAGPCA
jgi:hypothetical protein